jgi:OOP family OmpA-OmpF porin
MNAARAGICIPGAAEFFSMLTRKGQQPMTKRLNTPVRRVSAIAIAAALAAFAGVAGAQPRMDKPGYVVNSAGDFARSGSGACIRNGQWTPQLAHPACEGTAASARVAPAASSTSVSSPRAAAAVPASAAAGQSAASTTATGPLPGYAVSSGRVVQNGFGQCVRAGHWTPANAAEPCDRVARAAVAAPPPPVVAQAPEPKLEPAPAKVEEAPAPIAQPAPVIEPPRPVIQQVTLSSDVLFDLNSAVLKDSGKNRLDQLAAEVKGANVDEIIAVGHADRIGSDDHNQKLSEARAQAVKDYLQGKVANANRVTAEGKGESQPVTGERCRNLGAERGSNAKLVDCLQPDRRVEIEVLGTREVAGTPASPAGTGATGSTSGSASGGSTTR